MAMSTTPAATVRAATSLTGLGNAGRRSCTEVPNVPAARAIPSGNGSGATRVAHHVTAFATEAPPASPVLAADGVVDLHPVLRGGLAVRSLALLAGLALFALGIALTLRS